VPKALSWLSTLEATDHHWPGNFAAFRGHSDWIRSVAFSADGRLLASGSDDSSVRIWDVEMGTTQHTLPIRRGWVYSVAFSSKGIVAAGSDYCSITLWDSATGRELRRLTNHLGTPTSICFTGDGSKLAAADLWTVRIWDLDTDRPANKDEAAEKDPPADRDQPVEGDQLTDKDQPDRTNQAADKDANKDQPVEIEGGICVVFSSDGTQLATGSIDAKIHIWDVQTRKLRRTFKGHEEAITSVAFSPDMQLLASGSEDCTSGIWDLKSETGQRLRKLKPGQHAEVNSVAFSRDGSRFAFSTSDTIHIWNTKTWEQLQVMQARSFDGVCSVVFAPSGTYLASGSSDNAVHLWYAAPKPVDEEQQPQQQLAERNPIIVLAISPDGRTIAAAHSGGTISLWDMETNKLIREKAGSNHTQNVYSLMFSPHDGGKMLLSSSSDETVQVSEVASGKLLHRFAGHAHSVRSASWSSDGAYIASASNDSTIRIWKIGGEGDDKPSVLKDAHGGAYAQCVAFSPNGNYIISGGNDSKVAIWQQQPDQNTWERKHALVGHSEPVVGVCVSPDSKRVISSSLDKTLRIWDIERGDSVQAPIKINWAYTRMWFDSRSSDCVMTALGLQSLSASSSDAAGPPRWCPYRFVCGEDSQWWIAWEKKKIILLPSGFRPVSSGVLNHRLAVSTGMGRFQVYKFS
jgi:WD40 repeat protein